MKHPFAFAAPALAILLAAAPAAAQMRYLAPGQDGFGAHAVVTRGDESFGFGGAVVATVAGRVDLGLTVEHSSLDAYFGNVDARVTAVTPRVALGLARSARRGTGIELSLSYEMDAYASDWLVARDRELDARVLAAMISTYAVVRVSSTSTFYPELDAGYVSSKTTQVVHGASATDPAAKAFAFRVGASVLFRERFRITPAVLLVDGEPTWSTTVGFVWAGKQAPMSRP